MAKVRFLYDNRWQAGTLYSYSSQHNNFPATASQHPWPTYPWRSRYGSGSGWGRFEITASVNDRLDFDQGAGALAASLTAGMYTATTLASHIQTQMNAVGTGITVSYSDTTRKFTITKASGTLNLRWQTGANVARSVGDTIGYLTAADDTGSLSYAADNVRIHTSEELAIDLAAAESIDTVAVFGHNLQGGASMRLQGSSSSTFATTPFDQALTVASPAIVELMTAGNYRYWRLLVVDRDNPAGYVQVGLVVSGSYKELSRNCLGDWELTPEDPTQKIYSAGRQLSADRRAQYHTLALRFDQMTLSDLTTVREMFAQVGTSGGVLVAIDAAAHKYDWTWLMTFTGAPRATISKVQKVSFALSFEEVL